MILPIGTDVAPARGGWATGSLIAVCAVVLVWQKWFYVPGHNLPDLGGYWVASDFGLVPSALFGDHSSGAVSPWLSLVTHIFLHADLAHLIGNAVFLWVFGPGLEAAMGRVRFLLFYLLCGVIAGIGQAFMDPTSIAPAIGASGAVSGVLGAFVLFYPRAKVVFLTHPAIHLGPIRGSCPLVLGLYLLRPMGIRLPQHLAGLLRRSRLLGPHWRFHSRHGSRVPLQPAFHNALPQGSSARDLIVRAPDAWSGGSADVEP